MKFADTRIVVVLALLLVVGFSATSGVSYFSSRESLHRQIAETTLPLTSDNIYSDLERDLLRPLVIASSMAGNTFLLDWVAAGERSPDAMIAYLRGVQSQHNATTAFFVSEATRRYYHPNGVLKTVSPDDVRDAWYFRVRDSAGPYEVNLDRDTADPARYTAFINYQVRGPGNRFLGAIGVGLDVRSLATLLRAYRARYSRDILFADRDGRILLPEASNVPPGTLQADAGMGPHAREILNLPSTAFRYTSAEGEVFVNTRRIPELGWVLVVRQSSDPRDPLILTALVQNLLIALSVSGVILVVAGWTVRGYQRRLERLATTDELTGMLNRAAFASHFSQVSSACQRRKEPLAVILFDVDHFKRVNDTHGHQAGDRVLQQVARVTAAQTRASDLLFRWGGEEFLLLLINCDEVHALSRAENLRSSIRSSPAECGDASVCVTLSLGVTVWKASETAEEMIKRADQALYAAKRQGRDRVVVAG